uniref:Uncharacterized protein n=1 Tax=Mustela putorius furo TaxID=9669 RepID=M3Y593_MUSPF
VSFFSSPCPAPCSGVSFGSFRGLSRPCPSVRPHQRGSLADLSLLSFTKKPAPDSQRSSLRGPPPPRRTLPCRVTAHGGRPAPDPGAEVPPGDVNPAACGKPSQDGVRSRRLLFPLPLKTSQKHVYSPAVVDEETEEEVLLKKKILGRLGGSVG